MVTTVTDRQPAPVQHTKGVLLRIVALWVLAILLGASPSAVHAQEICYAVADNDNTSGSPDLLVRVNRNTGAEVSIGALGTANVESIAFSPFATTLYAANAGQFGRLNTTTGAFTAIGTGFGTGNGTLGSVTFSDVDGLHYDPVPGPLYGVHRRGNGNDSNNDVLFQINPATGTYIAGAFSDLDGNGQPDDYMEIRSGQAVSLWDIDDLAIDPSTAKMYAAANNGGSNDELVEINRTTGAVTLVGNMGVNDIEGLGFDTDGDLFGTSGTSGTPANSIFDVNKSNGSASLIANLSAGNDYESVACLTDGSNTITGRVYFDADLDATRDAGETGEADITVRLYRDLDNDGVVDTGEPLLGTQQTDANGDYTFQTASTGDFVLEVDLTTLPGNSELTTDNVERANFATLGNTDAGNDFGYNYNTITGRVFLDVDEDATRDAGETGEAGITVRLYDDLDNDGVVDAGEPVLDTQDTDANGDYTFLVGTGNFVLDIDTNDLPAGTSLTTDNVEEADFASLGNTDPGNDFGYVGPPSLTVDKVSDASGPVSGGQTITYTITITNTGSTNQTNVTVEDPLQQSVQYVANSTSVTLKQGGSGDTYRDEFDSKDYNGSDGNTTWPGFWTETGDDGSATGGDLEVKKDGSEQFALYYNKKAAVSLKRGLDLSSYGSAVLTFTYRRQGMENRTLTVTATPSGGSPTTIATITGVSGGITDAAYQASGELDLTSYISSNTVIEFAGSYVNANDKIYVDDIQIEAFSSSAGNAPPTLTSGQTLAPGDEMIVTFQVTVDNPPTCDIIYNWVGVSTDEEPAQRTDLVADPVSGTGLPTCNALPVELTSFEVVLDGNDAMLRWETASETNNAGFYVESRAATTNTFYQHGFVEGYGTIEYPQHYQYRVEGLDPGRHTFRLKQIDYDGTFEYHPEVEVVVEMGERFFIEPVYPNPFNPQAQFRFAVSQQQAVDVALYDLLGRRVETLYAGLSEAGQVQVVRIDGSGLPSGVYLVRVAGERFVETQAITLLK